jgi:pimeloyl-ACP methyl ester carboxylesterase
MIAWARSVAQVINLHSEPFILVGHSRGGVLISQVAELVPDRIQLSVNLTASLMVEGECTTDLLKLLPEGTFSAPPWLVLRMGWQ